ncbi:MAG TPA: response regulator transcription factor [Bryobacterales bacterium]|nr:response regulator transcription factor [Bryobacterales bacterium]
MLAPETAGSITARRTIRLAIADIHTLFRAGLRKLLAAEEDFEVVGEAGDGSEIFTLLEHSSPDILLLDLNIPVVSGLDVLRHFQAQNESGAASASIPRILILTASEDEEELAQAMKLGACGVVLKTTPTELLMDAIRKVSNGEIWLDGRVTANVIKNLADSRFSGSRGHDDASGLTPREREIAALVGQGYKYREIAEMLSISEQTVKNHLRNMFHKLGVSDRLQLALYAIHHNL